MRTFNLDGQNITFGVPGEESIWSLVRLNPQLLDGFDTILQDDDPANFYGNLVYSGENRGIIKVPKDYAGAAIGFRPFMRLGDLSKGWKSFDRDDGDTVRMYTMLVGDIPILIPDAMTPPSSLVTISDGGHRSNIRFTDEYYGDDYLLPWIFLDGLAYCTVIPLLEVSHLTLSSQGYI